MKRRRGSNLSTALTLEDASAMRGHASSAAGIYRPFKKNPPNPHLSPALYADSSGLSVNIFFLYQRHIFQPLSKREEGASEGRGLRGHRVGVKFFPLSPLTPFSPPSLVCCCLPASCNIWHCLSPGLLVQTGKERLRGEHSANLIAAKAGFKDRSGSLQARSDFCRFLFLLITF